MGNRSRGIYEIVCFFARLTMPSCQELSSFPDADIWVSVVTEDIVHALVSWPVHVHAVLSAPIVVRLSTTPVRKFERSSIDPKPMMLLLSIRASKPCNWVTVSGTIYDPLNHPVLSEVAYRCQVCMHRLTVSLSMSPVQTIGKIAVVSVAIPSPTPILVPISLLNKMFFLCLCLLPTFFSSNDQSDHCTKKYRHSQQLHGNA